MYRKVLWMLVAAAGLADAAPAVAQVGFTLQFDASANVLTETERAQITSHVQEAGRRWALALGVTAQRSIEVRIRIDVAVPTANGGSESSGFVGVINGRNTFEQGVAFELRTGTDVNGATPDATITFGLDYLRNELWFDPDPVLRTAAVPVNRTDAMSVALHELGHIVVYNGWADLVTGVPPATFWSTFDRWMVPGAPTVFAGAAAVQSWGSAPDVTTGNNKHWGNGTPGTPWTAAWPAAADPVQWVDGRPKPPVACQMPASVDAPASADLIDRERLGSTLIDELMNGVVYYRGTRYDITPLDRATLLDVGLLGNAIFANGFESP